MKKLIVVALVAAVAIFAVSVAHADTAGTSKAVAVEVMVSEVFGFTLWDADLAQSFTVIPGAGAIGNLHITASSNHTLPWAISASSAGMTGLYHFGTLPVVMTVTSPGTGTSCAENSLLTGSAQAIYTAGAGEYPKQGVQIGAMFVVPTTADTAQDVYQGTIALTMTD